MDIVLILYMFLYVNGYCIDILYVFYVNGYCVDIIYVFICKWILY